MSFNLVRLPQEQGILTNAEEEQQQVLLEVIIRMVFDAGLQRIAEAVNDSIDIVTSCHHQEPENPKNYTLENLAHNKRRAKRGKHTHTHTHTNSHPHFTILLQQKTKKTPLLSLLQQQFKMTVLFVVPGPVLKQLHREEYPQQEKTLTANRFRIQQPNGTKWRESSKTKPKCLPAAQVTGTSAIRDRKKRNLFDSSSSSSSHSLLCSCRLLIHLSRLMKRQPNLQDLYSSPSRRCLVAILETPSSERQIGERRSGKKREEEERSCFSFCEKEKKRMRRKKKGEIKVLDFSFAKKKRKGKKRMRTREKKGEKGWLLPERKEENEKKKQERDFILIFAKNKRRE
jgi:hypothetical protein